MKFLIEFYSRALDKRVTNWFDSCQVLPDAIIKQVKIDKEGV